MKAGYHIISYIPIGAPDIQKSSFCPLRWHVVIETAWLTVVVEWQAVTGMTCAVTGAWRRKAKGASLSFGLLAPQHVYYLSEVHSLWMHKTMFHMKQESLPGGLYLLLPKELPSSSVTIAAVITEGSSLFPIGTSCWLLGRKLIQFINQIDIFIWNSGMFLQIKLQALPFEPKVPPQQNQDSR